MALPKVAVMVGPTAVGKTAVALELAAALGGEIVNADSMQVYRGLDIGTAKPTLEERARVRHHLVDVADPDEPYDAARYSEAGRAVIARLHQAGVPPLVAGGTGLYIKALLAGLFQQDQGVRQVRPRLARELAAQGLPALWARLQSLDPATAARLAPGDTYRIVRALEVVEATGRPLSDWHAAHNFQDRPYETVKLGLELPREELYRESRPGWRPCWPRGGWRKSATCWNAIPRRSSPCRPWGTATWWPTWPEACPWPRPLN